MTQKDICPYCQAELPTDSPEGLCANCLMKGLLVSDSDVTPENGHIIEGPGTKIGHYELMELIGEGGMGLVYLAEQKEPVKRKVALKIVKLGMDTKQVVVRFGAERQTLALLEHPNIAHVFDAGTTETGRPYFVMEYVEGKSITKYCDEQKLSVEERLGLFQHICEGLHHAHQKGIIHRDIKPSNILVSIRGEKAVPKIIDFGIAKAITQPMTENTPFTEHGQLLGTPEYMSPEQADMAYQDVDTRSDIYSLGVLLYELLTGATPFDAKRLREGGIDHIQQVISEEEPRTPSARLTSLGDKAKAVAESRRTQIITLTRRLHRELEWIPMKAMRKDRTRRYRSASELADDVENYLTGVPLIAGPESTVYRARKFVRKHAGSVATASLLLVVIVLGLVASILMGCRAEQAREQEVFARKQVEEALVRAENAERIAQEQRKKAQDLAENYRRTLYFNRIALADVAHRNNDVRRLHELLGLCPEDLRGWEWHRLSHISDDSCMTLQGNKGWTIAVSLDGKRIASGSQDNTIKVWSAITGVELMTLRGHDARVSTVAFSPDGTRIASAAYNGTIKIWDVASAKDLMTLKGHKGAAGAFFSPDGKTIVSGSLDKTIKIWDAITGSELRTIQAHEEAGLIHAISPDGKRIVSGGRDKLVKVWDASTGAEVIVLSGHQESVNAVKFSPDGQRIVSGSWDRTIKIWDTSTGDELMTILGHKGQVLAVAFSPDGKRIASGSRDGTVKLWDGSTGAELATFRGHEGYISSVEFSPDGRRIISGSWDDTIKLWDASINTNLTHVHVNGGAWEINFSPDSRRILSGNRNGTIKVWDRSMEAEPITLRGREGDAIVSANFSPDGKRIISCQATSTVVWDVATGAKLMSLRGHEGYLLASFSPDGKQLVSMSVDSDWNYIDDTIELRDAETGREVKTFHGHAITCAAFSPDGKRVVSGSTNGTITVWDTDTAAELMTFDGHGGDIDVRFTPDGKRIASRGPTMIKLWNADTGAEVMTLPEQVKGTWTMAVSSDGQRIIVGDRGGMVRLWDVATATEVMTLREQGMEGSRDLPAVVFSPDGNTIAIGGSTGITFLESGPRPGAGS
ncbi:protein kinase [Planctomycetota bacterium]